jgi:nitroreductase
MTPIKNSQLLEALGWRYATKAFDSAKPTPADVWATLEDALVLSPSSFGLQPYRFLVIDDQATREKLLPHTWGQRQVLDAARFVVFAARTGITEKEIDSFLALTASTRGMSPEALQGYRGMMTGMLLADHFKPRVSHWAALQAYIALGNLMTSAALLGVDACPIEGFVPAEYDKVLGLPAQGYAAVVCCALGYRSAGCKYATAKKVRAAKADLIKTV